MIYHDHFDDMLGTVMRARLTTTANEDLRDITKAVEGIADKLKSEYPAGAPSRPLRVPNLDTPTFTRRTAATSATEGVNTKVEEHREYTIAKEGMKKSWTNGKLGAGAMPDNQTLGKRTYPFMAAASAATSRILHSYRITRFHRDYTGSGTRETRADLDWTASTSSAPTTHQVRGETEAQYTRHFQAVRRFNRPGRRGRGNRATLISM